MVLLVAVCAFYAFFAASAPADEVLSWTGLVEEAKIRAVPVVFVAHALTGGVALVVGALQFSSRLRARSRNAYRILGRVYVGAVWTASAGGLWSALFFDVSSPSGILFVVAAILWFAATTAAFQQIRRRRMAGHREWMIRSFALCLFFVTFEPWVAGLQASGLPRSTAYSRPLSRLVGQPDPLRRMDPPQPVHPTACNLRPPNPAAKHDVPRLPRDSHRDNGSQASQPAWHAGSRSLSAISRRQCLAPPALTCKALLAYSRFA